ncbi:hypothetical protein CMUS01_14743 [Colletotrichum musicola]|uniref:Apple domain-containing protein n=1 Tax=Colletotrichum musicola TaxID=2175873 RepID=A0A8H6MQV0_9PEZI|nr:hypothetical protein CMUS01_14743 [Colletotrichum musicola]
MTSPCLSPSALCGVEAPWGRGGFFGRRLDLANPAQCLEFCSADRTWGQCISFSFSSSGTCWIHDAPAADVVGGGSGTGIWIWDKECWDSGELGPIGDVPTRTTSAATATATCLPPTAKCEVEARWKGDEAVGSWGRYAGGEVEDGPYGCWEVCTDARRPDRCEAFSWEPSEGVCLFYDHTADESHDEEPGSDVWVWDVDCWRCSVSGYV